MKTYFDTSFHRWIVMSTLFAVLPLFMACNNNGDNEDEPGIDNTEKISSISINGEEWYDAFSQSRYSCSFTNGFYDQTSIGIVLSSSKDFDPSNILSFAYTFYHEIVNPAALSKGQILDVDRIWGGAMLITKNQSYTLEWTDGDIIFLNYDEKEQIVTLSLKDIVLQNSSNNLTYVLNGGINLNYEEIYLDL